MSRNFFGFLVLSVIVILVGQIVSADPDQERRKKDYEKTLLRDGDPTFGYKKRRFCENEPSPYSVALQRSPLHPIARLYQDVDKSVTKYYLENCHKVANDRQLNDFLNSSQSNCRISCKEKSEGFENREILIEECKGVCDDHFANFYYASKAFNEGVNVMALECSKESSQKKRELGKR